MTAEHFDGSLKTLRQRTPFRPFTVELISGDRFEVDYPDALVLREGVAVFIAPGGIPRLFEHESVSQFIADYNSETRRIGPPGREPPRRVAGAPLGHNLSSVRTQDGPCGSFPIGCECIPAGC